MLSQINLENLEADLKQNFAEVDQISLSNHKKVAAAFKEAKVGTEHFTETSGYGHDDLGRAKLDELFALVFKTESALARINFVSGTHAIACAILGNLKINDEIVFAFGRPYDTLEDLLKFIVNNLNGQVKFAEAQNPNNFAQVKAAVFEQLSKKTKMLALQRSRGYSALRPSYSVLQLAELIKEVKAYNKDIICFVDNCYGEFVERLEPTEVGADLMAGSLIKNPGGGIVSAGGYVVGKKALVANSADRLTCPGVGAEGGPNFGQGRLMFQGLYLAPNMVNNALKSMFLASRVFAEVGLQTNPDWNQVRTDIIQRVDLGSREKLISFCKLLQNNSPIDSHLTPQPAVTPGYRDELIMAAGTFIEGSTLELSADGPLREPFSAYLQGGLSYNYTKIFLEQFLASWHT
jgi:cystathionine beta-lyase family protein involved in aluminum resistance